MLCIRLDSDPEVFVVGRRCETDSNIAGQRAKRPEFDERCPVERERAVWAVNIGNHCTDHVLALREFVEEPGDAR